MTTIDSLLIQAKHGAQMSVPSTWGQGRTVFGGLSAALLNSAMVNELNDARLMRVQNIQFIGPLLLDEPFEIQVTHLRDGKNVTQMLAQLIQDGKIAVQAMAAFGTDRESKATYQPEPAVLSAEPVKPNWIPQIPKVTPKFHRYIDLRIDEGGYPFTGKSNPYYRGWMRFTDASEQITDAHIIALLDVWPPTTLQLLKWPAPASTLSWNVEFTHPHPELSASDWLAYECKTRQAGNGYAHTEATIHAPNGQLIALSRQTITVFD
ncbi:acyl-CoA thioesterase [Reinekea sp.]|jgi:acyl-CoA thioesterase|uniref:acyl-CoA thioesterase n=1 Tax=Reinekea sp. TaxID=1970455 RepID=UPI003989C459